MHRMLAILEREMRRFRRSPALIMMSLVMPIAQLVVLGYAFGGQVRNLKLGIVNQDHRLPSVKLRELCFALIPAVRPDATEFFLVNGAVFCCLQLALNLLHQFLHSVRPL